MTDITPHLGITLLSQAQSQKEVTINEAILILEMLQNTGVISMALSSPPGSPADGDLYVVAATGSGAWTGQTGKFAYYINGGWIFLTPLNGVTVWNIATTSLLVYNGSSFVDPLSSGNHTFNGNTTFNNASGTSATFINTNAITPGSRSAGWYSNGSNPGNFLYDQGRMLVGEATVNAGKSSANGEWCETLSQYTVTQAQIASVNTTGGSGLLGASRTSDSPSAGMSFNMGTQGVTGIVNNDNTSSLQTCYAFYGEAWKQATAKAENIIQGMEITAINLYGNGGGASPYDINAGTNNLIETLRIASGKPGTGTNYTVSTGLSIVNTGGNFENGIVFDSTSLTSDNRAICMAKGHQIIWFKPGTTGAGAAGPIIRSDVDTGQAGMRIIFADSTIFFQDGSGNNRYRFATSGPMRAQLILSSDQAIADSTATNISWDSALIDTGSFFSGGSPTRLTIPANGLYRLKSGIQFAANATGTRTMQINKNGSGVYNGRGAQGTQNIGSGGGTALNCQTMILSLSSGDYFEVNVSQNSGGNLNLQGTRCWFEIELVAYS